MHVLSAYVYGLAGKGHQWMYAATNVSGSSRGWGFWGFWKLVSLSLTMLLKVEKGMLVWWPLPWLQYWNWHAQHYNMSDHKGERCIFGSPTALVCFMIADFLYTSPWPVRDSIHSHASLVHVLIRCRLRPGREHVPNKQIEGCAYGISERCLTMWNYGIITQVRGLFAAEFNSWPLHWWLQSPLWYWWHHWKQIRY